MPEPPRTAYLPPRAARARKLILRSRLGLPWILAAAAFALVILVAGALLLSRGGRPGAPWVEVAPLRAAPAGAVTQLTAPDGLVVVADRRGARLRTLVAPPGPCPVVAAGSGYARPCTDQRWAAEGDPLAGTTRPLRPVPAQIARDTVYVRP